MSRPEFAWAALQPRCWSCTAYGDLEVGRAYRVGSRWFLATSFDCPLGCQYEFQKEGKFFGFSTVQLAQAKLEELFAEHEVSAVTRALGAAGPAPALGDMWERILANVFSTAAADDPFAVRVEAGKRPEGSGEE